MYMFLKNFILFLIIYHLFVLLPGTFFYRTSLPPPKKITMHNTLAFSSKPISLSLTLTSVNRFIQSWIPKLSSVFYTVRLSPKLRGSPPEPYVPVLIRLPFRFLFTSDNNLRPSSIQKTEDVKTAMDTKSYNVNASV